MNSNLKIFSGNGDGRTRFIVIAKDKQDVFNIMGKKTTFNIPFEYITEHWKEAINPEEIKFANDHPDDKIFYHRAYQKTDEGIKIYPEI